MLSPARISAFLGSALLALVLLSGCAKEEVVAPAAAAPVSVKALQIPGSGNGTVDTGSSGTDNSPITDDGDDMGDNERTTKPK